MDKPAAWIYIATLVVLVLCLARGQARGNIDLWDLVRASKGEKVFTDGRKLFETGAFAVMTITFCYLALLDKLSEMYATIYVGAFVTARFLRDREQRLNLGPPKSEEGGK